jgi:hypothetical protein
MTNHLKVESLMIAQAPSQAQADTGTKSGGGDFGGGSSSDF